MNKILFKKDNFIIETHLTVEMLNEYNLVYKIIFSNYFFDNIFLIFKIFILSSKSLLN